LIAFDPGPKIEDFRGLWDSGKLFQVLYSLKHKHARTHTNTHTHTHEHYVHEDFCDLWGQGYLCMYVYTYMYIRFVFENACMRVCVDTSVKDIRTHTHSRTHTAVAKRKESAAPDRRHDTRDFPAQPGRNSRGTNIIIITIIIIIIMIRISLSTQEHAQKIRDVWQI